MSKSPETVAEVLVSCLEAEGVEYMFGIPGEENIRLVDATSRSNIRFILVQHEQAAAFMADIYGRLTGKAGVCTATLGPGAINLLLGVADAQTDSTPLVAISAQVGLNRIYKETHQVVDLVSTFKPVTKWADTLLTAAAAPEVVRTNAGLLGAGQLRRATGEYPRRRRSSSGRPTARDPAREGGAGAERPASASGTPGATGGDVPRSGGCPGPSRCRWRPARPAPPSCRRH
jgi:hypothetical protein